MASVATGEMIAGIPTLTTTIDEVVLDGTDTYTFWSTIDDSQERQAFRFRPGQISMLGVFGVLLILAAYANLMPKDVGRWPASARAAAKSQSVLRVGGWMLTLLTAMGVALALQAAGFLEEPPDPPAMIGSLIARR